MFDWGYPMKLANCGRGGGMQGVHKNGFISKDNIFLPISKFVPDMKKLPLNTCFKSAICFFEVKARLPRENYICPRYYIY